MKGYNKVILMGNLTRDPEIRYTANQKAVASFTVAINRQWKDQNGEKRDEVTYINCVIWGAMAEALGRYAHKGTGVMVEGRINTRSYEDKTGTKKYVTEVIADTVQFVGGGQQNGQNSSQGYQNRPPAPQPARQPQNSWQPDAYGMGEPGPLPDCPAPVEETADIPF